MRDIFDRGPLMLILDGGSTSIADFLPNPRPSIPAHLDRVWTAAYPQIAPDAVFEWHKSFLDAGADIIITDTYQIPLARDLPDANLPGLIHSAVAIAHQAILDHGKGSIALSLGTRNAHSGKGEYAIEPQASIAEYKEFHTEKLHEFYSAVGELWEEVRYLAFETVSSFEEATAILEVLRRAEEYTYDKKAWITFSCGDGSSSRMKNIVSRLLNSKDISHLWGIGFNCVGIDIVKNLAEMLDRELEGSNLRMILYPDAGRWIERTTAQFTYDTKPSKDEDVQNWAECLAQLGSLNGGAVVLGGCCNSDSRFITALAKATKNKTKSISEGN